MTVHERPVGSTVEWYTPSKLFERLGSPTFSLDPAAAPPNQRFDPRAYVAARRYYGIEDDGLAKPWDGHVWLNPPYGPAGVAFVKRMIAHGDGLLLLPSRTETGVYQQAFAAADLVCLLRDRIHFVRHDGFQARASFGSTLFAFGDWAADILRAAHLGLTISADQGPAWAEANAA